MKDVLLYLSMLITIPASQMHQYERIASQLNVNVREVIEQAIIAKIGFQGLYEITNIDYWDGLESTHPKYGEMQLDK